MKKMINVAGARQLSKNEQKNVMGGSCCTTGGCCDPILDCCEPNCIPWYPGLCVYVYYGECGYRPQGPVCV
jgi:hypothetical protein